MIMQVAAEGRFWSASSWGRRCGFGAQRFGSIKDIQTQMRHASPLMALKEYQQPIPERVKTLVAALDQSLFGAIEATGRPN